MKRPAVVFSCVTVGCRLARPPQSEETNLSSSPGVTWPYIPSGGGGWGGELCTDLFHSQTGAKRSGAFPAFRPEIHRDPTRFRSGGLFFRDVDRRAALWDVRHIPSSIFRSCDNTPVSRVGWRFLNANVSAVQELSSWKSNAGVRRCSNATEKGFLRVGCSPPSSD